MAIVGYGIVGLIWGHAGRVDGALSAQYAPPQSTTHAFLDALCHKTRPVPTEPQQSLHGTLLRIQLFLFFRMRSHQVARQFHMIAWRARASRYRVMRW